MAILLIVQRERPTVFLCNGARGVNVRICMIARQLGHDVAVPWRGTVSMKNLGQRAAEASSGSVTPGRRKVGLEVSPVDAVTLSDGEGRENAHGAA